MKMIEFDEISVIGNGVVLGMECVLIAAGKREKSYAVFKDGDVYCLNAARYMTPEVRKDGYTNTNLGGKRCSTHRLVLFAYKGPPFEGAVCRHLDGDVTNNHADNLEWGTWAENSKDRIAHGTDCVGEKSPLAKLTWAAVLDIRSATKDKSYIRMLAKKYGVHERTVREVRYGRTWS